MKRLVSLIVVVMMVFCCTTMAAFASEGGNSLDDVISEAQQDTQNTTGSQDTNTDSDKTSGMSSEQAEKNQSFIAGLGDAANLTDPVEGVDKVTPWIKQIAGFIVQVVSYAVIILLAARVVIDLAYIGLPFTRSFLGNGYSGAGMQGGQPGMGGMMGGGMMNNRYNMGGMMNNRYSMGGGMMGGGMMGSNPGMGGANQTGQMMGRIQWVSNAALRAADMEGQPGPDGREMGPLKSYMKNMVVILVAVPILLILAATGTLTQFGLLLADKLVDLIAMAGDML